MEAYEDHINHPGFWSTETKRVGCYWKMEGEMTYSILDITAGWANTCDHTSSFYKGKWKIIIITIPFASWKQGKLAVAGEWKTE